MAACGARVYLSALVVEWAAMHLEELRSDWGLATAGQPLSKIEPLR